MNVPAFDRILIHVGNIASQYGKSDSMGCILVGFNKVKGQVINSTNTFKKLYSLLTGAKNKQEKITLTIE